jgi:extradiol dioxygenase family protein
LYEQSWRPDTVTRTGRDAKIDWKALSKRIGHADVAFTMKQYVQTDLEADRQVANTLASPGEKGHAELPL